MKVFLLMMKWNACPSILFIHSFICPSIHLFNNNKNTVFQIFISFHSSFMFIKMNKMWRSNKNNNNNRIMLKKLINNLMMRMLLMIFESSWVDEASLVFDLTRFQKTKIFSLPEKPEPEQNREKKSEKQITVYVTLVLFFHSFIHSLEFGFFSLH